MDPPEGARSGREGGWGAYFCIPRRKNLEAGSGAKQCRPLLFHTWGFASQLPPWTRRWTGTGGAFEKVSNQRFFPLQSLAQHPRNRYNRSVQDPCRGTSSQTAGSQARTPCLPGGGDRPTAGHLLPCRLQSVQQHQGFPGAAAPASGSTSRVSIPGLPRSEKG